MLNVWSPNAWAGCPTGLDVSKALQTVQFEQVRFTVAVPDSCRNMSCGSILDVHGALMSVFDQEAGLHIRALAGALPMIVVQPQAPGSPPLWDPSLSETVFAGLSCLNEALHADTRRRYVDGFSQGAFMAAAFYCRHPGYFSAYALIAGGTEMVAGCLATKHAPLLYIHGRHDELVDFSYATDFIKALDALTPAQTVSPGKAVYRTANFDIETVFHDGQNGLSGGHCLPGGDGRLGCVAEVSAGKLIVAFFSSHAGA